MNNNCCIPGASEKLKEILECEVKEDEEGILISVRPKDKANKETLKEFYRSSQKLFGNVCGCC